MPLTRDQIKAMKNAESVVFHREHRVGEQAKDYAIAKRDHDPGDGFGTRELTVTIPIGGSRFETYSLPGAVERLAVVAEHEAGDDLVTGPQDLQHRRPLGAVAPTNARGPHDVALAGLSHDEFKLEVIRTTKSGTRRFVFWLDDMIVPSNSAARMATRSTKIFS